MLEDVLLVRVVQVMVSVEVARRPPAPPTTYKLFPYEHEYKMELVARPVVFAHVVPSVEVKVTFDPIA
jgi:hypothetical protein